MAQRFADRVVLITGATSGVGEAVARRVAAEGAAVVLGARGKEAGMRVAEQIRADGGRAVFVPTDVRNEEEVAALTRAAVDEFGRSTPHSTMSEPSRRTGRSPTSMARPGAMSSNST